jgi:hypothetical protein
VSLAAAHERHSHLGLLVILPCGLRHCSTLLTLTPVLEFSQSAALPSPRPSLPCGLHYCPHPHVPIPVPASVMLTRRYAVLPRLVISCIEPQYYILSSFSLRYAPRVSFPSIVFVFPLSRLTFPSVTTTTSRFSLASLCSLVHHCVRNFTLSFEVLGWPLVEMYIIPSLSVLLR